MLRRFATRAFTSVFLLMLSACASLQPPAPTDASKLSESRSGRFSVTTYRSDAQTVLDRQSGNFNAERRSTDLQASYRIDLQSPLGQILARAQLQSNGASLETAQGQNFAAQGANADLSITQQALGLPIPLYGLAAGLFSNALAAPEGWKTEVLELSEGKPRRLRLTWMRQSDDSKHLNTLFNPEVGRIVVLVIVNE